MTFQVSDVVVNDQGLRRLVMLHWLIAFVFNIGAVALTVNVVGSINGMVVEARRLHFLVVRTRL